MSHPKIAAVVVTHNRLEFLQKCVAALRGQTRPCDAVLVVNNGCTDGTGAWLEKQGDLEVINQSNQGGAGGQAAGSQWAIDRGFDWVWLMDDDTIVESEALSSFLASGYSTDPTTGLLASTVYWRDGSLHVMNKPYPTGYPEIVDFLANPQREGYPILSASFVSILVRCDAVRKVGLPLRGTYLWGDDLEFTRRVTSQFKGYCILASKVLHDTPSNSGSVVDVNEQPMSLKQYCLIRNMIILPILSTSNELKKFFALIKRAGQLLSQARSWHARIQVLKIAVDAWQFSKCNSHFSLPLQNQCPIETAPPCWPKPLGKINLN